MQTTTRSNRLSWRAGFITLFWAFMICINLWILYHVYLFGRWALGL